MQKKICKATPSILKHKPYQLSYFQQFKKYSFFFFTIVFFTGISPKAITAQTVFVGQGSYTTSLPSGEVGPQNASGQNISPKISDTFSLPVQTNDYWSSLIFPFFGDAHSSVIYAHPINAKATNTGLELGYTSTHVFAANDYLYPFQSQLTVGVDGLNASKTVVDSYGDWTVTALWKDGTQSLKATLGHGLPFVYFTVSGGNAIIASGSTPTIWYNQNGILGITVDGRHYGIFAPSGSNWSGTSTFESSLNGQDYFSVAILPDNTEETLELFRKRAYAFVTNSLVNWSYDEASATLTTTYSYKTELKESANGNVDETLSALYRHLWLYAQEPVSEFTYESPNGSMKLFVGSEFTTRLKFSGILPSLPDQGDYNRGELLAFVQEVASETISVGPTYENGKAMGRFAQLIPIADQLGAITERDHFLSEIKKRLEDWFTVGGDQEYYYNDSWDVLTGYPSGFGADKEINDHHFHSSYAIRSAAVVAQYDPAWASQKNWGGMVNLLIKDANNWDRKDTQFPFLRSHDAYKGHSWASGHAAFGDGNNQESSSESMNFASAVFLWGAVTGQPEIRDLGIFLHTNETIAVEQYWFDVDNKVFPEDYPHVAIGIVWGAKGAHSTWFGADPEFIHGINLLPITSGSLYLGRHPEHVIANYEEIVAERNGQPIIWKDIIWEYLALADPNLALSLYNADPFYTPFDGESRAHTHHWLYNMKKMGRMDATIQANIPTYSVFANAADEKTYVAFNPGLETIQVNFTDGFSMEVPAREMKTHSTSTTSPDAPVALLFADKTSGKAPITVSFDGSKSFDRNGGDLIFDWEFGDEATSKTPDISYTFTDVGTYLVKLTVTADNDLSTSDSVLITVLGNGTPFGGTAPVVPAKIEAENYDVGGEGVAYHDVEKNNIGLGYRPDEGVDLEGANDGGFDVYWIVAGEWIEYTIEVTEEGEYDIIPYVSTVPGFGNFTLFVDNVDVSGRRNVLHTGGWQSWKPIKIKNVPLTVGTHILRYEFDSDSDKKGWLFSFNYMQISKSVIVSNEVENDLVSELKLTQNYPNPFNPSANIEFSLPSSGNVTLKIFNVVGQVVQVLVNENLNKGTHSVTFDAYGLSSGIYFYQLEFGGQILSKKMLLMK